MVFAGIPAEVLAGQLGHADSGVTRRIYVHLFDETESAGEVRRAASRALSLGQSLASTGRDSTGNANASEGQNLARIAEFRK